MKKTPISLLILLCALFFTSGVIAQNKPLACQVEAASGVDWENGQWVTNKFVTNKFLLVQTGNLLTKESVGKVFGTPSINTVNCSSDGDITCTLPFGRMLYFNPISLKGATSRLYGSTYTGSKKDSVLVEVFSCTPF